MGNHPRIIPLYREEKLDTRPCTYIPGQNRAGVIYTNNTRAPDLQARHDFQRVAVESGFELLWEPERLTVNNCARCQSCVQVRICVRDFEFSRDQRRVMRLHGDLTLTRAKTQFDDQQYELYAEYFKSRLSQHNIRQMNRRNFEIVTERWMNMQTLHMPETIDEYCGALVGAMYYEDCGNALILGNQYYNRDIQKRGFGTYGILSLIAMAKERGNVDYIYLGPWVKGSSILDYKKNFHPLEGFDGMQWKAFDPRHDYKTEPPKLDRIYQLKMPS